MMTSEIPLLNDIRVASPCSVSWDAMAGDGRMRFCGICRKSVYNLSGMTRAEAERLVRETEGRLCVRFYRRRDGTVLTSDCPVGRGQARRWLAIHVGGLAALLGGLLALLQPLVELLAALFDARHQRLELVDHLGQGTRLQLQRAIGFLALVHQREGTQDGGDAGVELARDIQPLAPAHGRHQAEHGGRGHAGHRGAE
jgi:hypothetical protein